MKLHCIKQHLATFDGTASGENTIQIRRNDRGYKSGDVLEIEEYDEPHDRSTGRTCFLRVKSVHESNYVPAGHVVMIVTPIPEKAAIELIAAISRAELTPQGLSVVSHFHPATGYGEGALAHA